MATAKPTGYEVLVDEVTVHRDVRELFGPDGSPRGFQKGQGKTWFFGEVIPEDEVSSQYRDALDDKDNPLHDSIGRKLKKVREDSREDLAARLGVPFAGYDDMEPDEIVAAMSVLPSATIQRIKEYEEANENRSGIVDYSIGFASAPDDRQLEVVEPDEPAEGKAAAVLQTREVPDSGPVVHGEGITGTGEPQKGYGSTDAEEKGDIKGTAARARRGRRDRQPKPGGGTAKAKGGSSLGKVNE